MSGEAVVCGGIVLGVLIGALVWLRAPVVVVKDSEAFVQALGIWYPVIIAKPFTPRTLKRFLNRVRFAAARMGDPKPEPSRWDELLAWLERHLNRPAPAAGAASTSAQLTEATSSGNPPAPAARDAMVVAFCVLAWFDARWLRDESAWKCLRGDVDSGGNGSVDPADLPTEDPRLKQALATHKVTFLGSWPPPDKDRARFLEIEQPA
jgi:hypothetical protein